MLRKKLKSLPATLDDTYERILCAIDEDHTVQAQRILRWLAFSARPLFLGEIAEVVAMDPESDPAFDRDEVLEDPFDALDICASLVTLSTENFCRPDRKNWPDDRFEYRRDKVLYVDGICGSVLPKDGRRLSLAHYSVKEYLMSDRIRSGPAKQYAVQESSCNIFVGKSCIAYLLQFSDAQSFSEETIIRHKLALYAARFWLDHVRPYASDEGSIQQLIVKLFNDCYGAYYNWHRIHDPTTRDNPNTHFTVDDIGPPLHRASREGLLECVRYLLSKPRVDINATQKTACTAVQVAASRGNEAVVKVLLDAGADTNVQYQGRGGSANALQAASMLGHTAIVKLLLDAGADVNAPESDSRGSALQIASEEGHTAVVEQLLDAGAVINASSQSGYGGALQAASYNGNEAVVRLLINAGADVNAQAVGDSYTVLHGAAMFGSEAVTKLLLDAGADPNSDTWRYSPLVIAARQGHSAVANLLIAAGADVNAASDQTIGSALYSASQYGYEMVVELLLNAGADINQRGGSHDTALNAAIQNGHNAVVKLLLDAGADVHAQSEGGIATPLIGACWGGHETMVELLLRAGVDVNEQGACRYALSEASGTGCEAIVKLLLRAGANVNQQGRMRDRYSAIVQASRRGHEAVVRMLLDAGADVNIEGGKALLFATKENHKVVVEMLLAAGAVRTSTVS